MLTSLDDAAFCNVLRTVFSYVLSGEKCDCENTYDKAICELLIDVINRKAQKAYNSSKNLPQKKKKETPSLEEKEEPQVSTMPVPKEEPAPPQEIGVDEDQIFNEFFTDQAMDYSKLLTNPDYVRQRKRDELNGIYKKLEKKYTANRIIEILQDKYAKRISKSDD